MATLEIAGRISLITILLKGCAMSRVLALILSAAALVACKTPQETAAPAAPEAAPAQEVEDLRIVGSLTYSQRMALPQDAVALIGIYEYGLAYAVTEPLAEMDFDLNGRQVPIPFEITVPDVSDIRSDQIEIIAGIADGENNLLWMSEPDQTVTVKAGLTEFGTLKLVPAEADIVTVADLADHEWMAAVIGGEPVASGMQVTIGFSGDGQISGQAPCNAYTGSYTLEDGKLSVGPLAMTRKACPPSVMTQEQAFISVLQAASLARINEEGVLALEDGEGGSILAR